MGAKGFWNETVRRVVQSTRDRAQSTAAQHPAVFAVVWLFKVLVIDLPIILVRGAIALVRGRKGRASRELVPAGKGRS